MEWRLFAFVGIEENLSPGPQPLLQLHLLRYTENWSTSRCYQSIGKLWCGVSKIKSIKNLRNTHIRICINCHYSYDEGNRRIRITRITQFRIMTGTRIRSSQLRGTKQANIGESNILLWITAEEPIRKYWHHAPLWAWAQKTVVHNTVPLAKKEWSNSHSPSIDCHRYGRTISAGSNRAKKVWFKHYALTENRARRCKYCGTQAI